jgi:hypothetical protein
MAKYYAKDYWNEIALERQKKEIKDSFGSRSFAGSSAQNCSHFGCGRSLSTTEQLYGSKCIHHSNTKTIQTFKHGGSV